MGMHQGWKVTPEQFEQANHAVSYSSDRLENEPGYEQQCLNRMALNYAVGLEHSMHTVAYDVIYIGGNRWEVLRHMDDGSVWMQSLKVGPFSDTDQRPAFYWDRPGFTKEQQVIQAAIVSGYKFKKIEEGS